ARRGEGPAGGRRASFFRPPTDSAAHLGAPGGPAGDPLPLPADLTVKPGEAAAARPKSGEGDPAAGSSGARTGQPTATAFGTTAGGSVKPSAFRDPPATQGPPVGAQLPRGGDVLPEAVPCGEVPIEGVTEEQ